MEDFKSTELGAWTVHSSFHSEDEWRAETPVSVPFLP